jgi:hypothetical protein
VIEIDAGLLVDVEVFVNAGYGYDARCELVCETGTLDLAPPATVMVRDQRSRSTDHPASKSVSRSRTNASCKPGWPLWRRRDCRSERVGRLRRRGNLRSLRGLAIQSARRERDHG